MNEQLNAAAAAAAGDQSDDDEDTSNSNNRESFACPRHDFRMNLTATERHEALAIKTAIEACPDIDDLPDFDYVQLALVDHSNVERALERARHFQTVRAEYGFQDSYDENVRLVEHFMQLMPKFMLDLAYNQDEGNYILVVDIANFEETKIRTVEDDKALMGTALNIGHFLCPDFFAIRQGAYAVMETEGYNWKQYTMKTRRRIWQEVLGIYPVNVKQLKYFNTGLVANLAASLMKRFLPLELFSKIQVGCTFSNGGRLDTFYAVPSHQVANQRFQARAKQCLQIRYEHRRTFRLNPDEQQDGEQAEQQQVGQPQTAGDVEEP
ncbi:expressed unknown protein [Seminavis robusta]|uniref:Uncharacterized protein n=1 Tax=Seminavis robusta TaxID=568900 RepID=A0A9N8EQY7_9STRA|nr:expressed unknown protein [Seminavis robusta]|eukprot:Sro1826_g300150.1 n/a (323) ;mRNA; r:15760-16728